MVSSSCGVKSLASWRLSTRLSCVFDIIFSFFVKVQILVSVAIAASAACRAACLQADTRSSTRSAMMLPMWPSGTLEMTPAPSLTSSIELGIRAGAYTIQYLIGSCMRSCFLNWDRRERRLWGHFCEARCPGTQSSFQPQRPQLLRASTRARPCGSVLGCAWFAPPCFAPLE